LKGFEKVGYPQESGGRGITTQALILLIYVLFTIHKINRLELKIVPENQASKRVAQKAGYQ
jgi:RimJ/RimL family protein N-acetyltransferase